MRLGLASASAASLSPVRAIHRTIFRMTGVTSQIQTEDVSTLSLFRYRDFRIFWSGSFVSAMGTQFSSVAMAWQIYEITHSAFQIGLLGLVRAVPQAILL